MSLADLFSPRRHKPDPLDMLASQISDLRRQTRQISKVVSHRAESASHRAGDTIEDWSDAVADLGREAAQQGAWLAGLASRNMVKGARAVQRDPIPLIAVVGTALLAVSLITRRR
ncbi:hypothetical protein SAMN05216456_1371 [Devosia crocina]|uniref:Membrane-anchored ribosome-binding protein, inhibits growth in stationary phase, ElaB/YqjD/DUF883 family n=1 Tax=Devosia crocina TaxID=429728 RepID=A0A1I7NA47_9HYPH|nr:hypothetical protein [Devosia crocina]SFV31535.1 hypothetical protein SAMN05216456_1371 [Devosia crocina]